MGGAIAQMARLFPHSGYDFGDRVWTLPADGAVPRLENWYWIYTSDHTHGHVSLFRETDGTLLAGDALATMDMGSWTFQLTRGRGLHWPPAPFTPGWEAARTSVERLAGLIPSIVAAGHGLPVDRPDLAEEMRAYAGRFSPLRTGRYAGRSPHVKEKVSRNCRRPCPTRSRRGSRPGRRSRRERSVSPSPAGDGKPGEPI